MSKAWSELPWLTWRLARDCSFALTDQHAPQLSPGRELPLPRGDPRGAVWLPWGPSGSLWWASERWARAPSSFIRMPVRGWEVTLMSDLMVPVVQTTCVRKDTGSVPGRMRDWKCFYLKRIFVRIQRGSGKVFVGKKKRWGIGGDWFYTSPSSLAVVLMSYSHSQAKIVVPFLFSYCNFFWKKKKWVSMSSLKDSKSWVPTLMLIYWFLSGWWHLWFLYMGKLSNM